MRIIKHIACCLVFAAVFYGCNNDDENKLLGELAGNDSIAQLISAHEKLFEEFKHFEFSDESQWDSLHGFDFGNIEKEKCQRHSKYKVMGWHLYSFGSAYKSYNFDLLWAVAYFSYELNPETGGYKDIHNWKTTALIDSAKNHDCKALLTITSFGSSSNKKFLSNEKAWDVLADSVISLLRYRGADGVSLDFENVPKSHRAEFSEFLIHFSKRLKKENKDYAVTLAIYAIDWNNVFDIASIDEYIDFYTLMGYDYYGSFSKTTGPVSPLHESDKFGSYCLEKSIADYLKKGVDSAKLILGLPYYGARWATKNENVPAEVESFVNSPSYSKSMSFLSKNKKYNLELDEASMTHYCKYNDGSEKQLWFDDSTTLAMKFDYVQYKNLAGVAIWALGYDNNYNQLWELLTDKFDSEPYNLEFSVQDTLHNEDTSNPNLLTRIKEVVDFVNNDTFAKDYIKTDKPWEIKEVVDEYNLVKTVYGFFPFWKGKESQEINFKLLSRMGYFSVVPDSSTGALLNLHNWDSLAFEKAHEDSCKIDLVVSVIGKKNIKRILKDNGRKQNLINDIVKVLQESEGDGITIDFNGLQRSMREKFADFIAGLSDTLKKSNPEYFLNVMIPPITSKVNYHFAYDISSLEKHVDLFLLMAYDYYGEDSKYAGPLAPLYSKYKWSPHNIDASMLKYVSMGISLGQLVIVYPNFGLTWQTKNNNIPSKVVKFADIVSYDNFEAQIAPNSKRYYDTISYSTCFIQEKDGQTYQTWIDDTIALGKKFDYINHNEIGGVGIWAVGDAAQSGSFWNLVKEKFAIKEEPSLISFKSLTKDLTLIDLFWIINVFLILIVLIVVLGSFLHYKISYFINKYILWFYAFGVLLVVATLFLMRHTDNLKEYIDEAVFISVILACIILIKKIIDKKHQDNLP